MSICAVILAGLQGKYAFYAAMPVALTFGKYNLIMVILLRVNSGNIYPFSFTVFPELLKQ